MRRTALLLGIALFAPSSAQAAEDELVLALEPGYALITGDGTTRHGGFGGVSAWLGINDELWLSAGGGGGAVRSDGDRGSVSFAEVFGGVTAALDVFRTIPFFEAQLGLVTDTETLSPTVRLGLGADHFVSRTVSVGLVARVRPIHQDLGGALFTATARLAVRLEL